MLLDIRDWIQTQSLCFFGHRGKVLDRSELCAREGPFRRIFLRDASRGGGFVLGGGGGGVGGRTGVTGTPRVATRPDQLPKEPRWPPCGGWKPCQIRHQDAVKIPGRERYITDSKTAAKPSSGFTIHGCQAFWALFLGQMLQTGQIELQNVLERLAKLGSKMSVTLLKRAAETKALRISCS